ncbi:hypothetical protein [Nitratireductor sp. GCM10026969]|uniref:hypothetical protein n=1 Tax=Nitratireductor sp. GCM10026969 TaxID=3252645 RepID=UPI00360DAF5D
MFRDHLSEIALIDTSRTQREAMSCKHTRRLLTLIDAGLSLEEAERVCAAPELIKMERNAA